jgi:hypothetical protein
MPAPARPTAVCLPPTGSEDDERLLIRVQPPGSFPQDGTCDLGERCTAGDGWRPLGTARLRWHVDQTWTRHARSRGQRRSASRTLPGKETPAGCPRQARPARAIALLGGALAGSGPGTSPYIRAVPGHRHGGTPASCLFKPRGRWWVLGRHGTTRPITPGGRELVRGGWGRWDSNPAPRCCPVQGRDGERPLTCDADSPMVTARARRGPAVPDAARIQCGPGHELGRHSRRVGLTPVRFRTSTRARKEGP